MGTTWLSNTESKIWIKEKPCKHAEMMSFPNAERNDNIFQILPMDKYHHEDTARRKSVKWKITMGGADKDLEFFGNVLTGATTKAPAFSVIKSLQTSLFLLEDLRCFCKDRESHSYIKYRIQGLFIIVKNFL